MISITHKLLKTFAVVGTLSLFIGCSLVVTNKTANNRQQTTVANIDLDNYQGTWYEIARLPMYFQRHCRSDVTTTYHKRADGKIDVMNQCTNHKGEQQIANGVASVDSNYPDAGNSRLLVSFLPNSLQWLPVGKGGYWILALDTDVQTGNYTHVMVGSPSRKYLWILSRTPTISNADYQRYVSLAEAKGYQLDKLMRTTHTQP